MTAVIEALYFLGPGGSVARNEEACVYCDSKHAAGVCLGTIQARYHVQLALACQRSTLRVQPEILLSAFLSTHSPCSLGKAMESPSSCVSTASSSGGNSARIMWNSILELLCHVRLRNLITPLIEDAGLEKLRSLATVPSISFATFQLAPVTNVHWSMAPLPQLQVRGLGLWQL